MLDKSIISKYLNKIEQSIRSAKMPTVDVSVKIPNFAKKEENTPTVNNILELYNDNQLAVRDEILSDRPKHVMYITDQEVEKIVSNTTISIHKSFGPHFLVATSEETDKYLFYMQQKGEVFLIDEIEGLLIYVSYDVDRYLDANSESKTFVYYMPSESFEPIINKKGDYVMEWMSQSTFDTSVLESEEIMLFNILNSGIQVLFLNSKEEFDEFVSNISNLSGKKKIISYIEKEIKHKKVLHENLEKGLKPVDFSQFI